MSDDKRPFRELHSLEKWDAISGALFSLSQCGNNMGRVAETARKLASKAGTWAFLTGDMPTTMEYGISTGMTEQQVEDRIAELEEWTSDTERWMDAYVEVLEVLTRMEKHRETFYEAMAGLKHDE